MAIELKNPELVAKINYYVASGQFATAEDLIEAAMHALDRRDESRKEEPDRNVQAESGAPSKPGH
jgi:Arc/MetJ-type ribon-helix-helix transcriptional regulator